MSEKLTNTERIHHQTLDSMDVETFLMFYLENQDRCNAEGYITDYDLLLEQEYTNRIESITDLLISYEE